jgi:hypothetical protein
MAGYIGQIPTPQATQHRESFTATASQTSFATAGYTAGFVDVYLNGVHLLNGTDYTATNGSDVVLTTGAAAGDVLEVISYSTFEVNSQNFTGDTTVANLDVTGTFTGTNLTLSGGVYLGGTGAANKLDDYEEGTFTPVFQRSGTQPSVTYTGQVGYYTKVGDTVFVSILMGVSSWSGGSGGTFRVAGLPFAVASGGGAYYSQATSIDNSYINLSAGYPPCGGYFSYGTTHIDMLAAGSGLTSSNSALTPQSAFAVYYSGHYRTTA